MTTDGEGGGRGADDDETLQPGWQDYMDLKRMLKALADVARLNIVHELARSGEVTVTDLAQSLLISQPLVSWHLAALRRAGIVHTQRQGRLVLCSLDRKRFQLCQQLLGEVVSVEAPAAQSSGTAARSVNRGAGQGAAGSTGAGQSVSPATAPSPSPAAPQSSLHAGSRAPVRGVRSKVEPAAGS